MIENIIVVFLVVLAAAIIIGEIFEQLGLPSVAGALLSGLLIGPSVLNIIGPSSALSAISSLAIFFIVLFLGLQMGFDTLIRSFRKAIALSTTSFIAPLAIGFVIALQVLQLGYVSDSAIVLALSVPSISIISVLLQKYKMVKTEIGEAIIASVILSDILAFLLLSSISEPYQNVLLVFGYAILFIMAFFIVDTIITRNAKKLRRRLHRITGLLKSENISFAIVIIASLLISVIFSLIGVSYIIGAFFAGLLIRESWIGNREFRRMSRTFGNMNTALFIPLFFGVSGIDVALTAGDLSLAPGFLIISAVIIFISFLLTKEFSSGLFTARPGDVYKKIAAILNGRGAIGIAIAVVALQYGLISEVSYSFVIVSTILISVVAGILLGYWTRE